MIDEPQGVFRWRPFPAVINNRDLMVADMVADLVRLGANEIHIQDNGSTYPPLLKWYNAFATLDSAPGMAFRWWGERNRTTPVFLHRDTNRGPRGACSVVSKMRSSWLRRGATHYATTDADLDLSDVADHALLKMGYLSALTRFVKIGSALRIDDLPDTEVGAEIAEARFWRSRWNPAARKTTDRAEVIKVAYSVRPTWSDDSWIDDLEAYEADIDTTLAVYRLDPPWDGAYGPSLRLAGQFLAAHLPWYHTDANRPADYTWYLDHADPQETVYTAATLAEREKRPA